MRFLTNGDPFIHCLFYIDKINKQVTVYILRPEPLSRLDQQTIQFSEKLFVHKSGEEFVASYFSLNIQASKILKGKDFFSSLIVKKGINCQLMHSFVG